MEKKKILFASMPFDGHFNPLTGIAMYLKEQGHDVRWYTSETFAEKLKKLDIPFFPYKKAREVHSENLHQVYPEVATLKGLKLLKFSFEKIFLQNIENHFLDVKEVHDKHFPFDLFFCDSALYALQMIKEIIGKPVYVIHPGPLLDISKDTPPNFIGHTPAKTWIGKKMHQLMRKVMDKMILSDGSKLYEKMRESHGLPPYNGSFWNISSQGSSLFFQSGVPEFEYYRSDLSPKIKFVGPLLPFKKAVNHPFRYPAKLNQYEKVLLISQGTVDNKDQNKLIIPALEALKDKNYLLIVTTGGINTLPLRQNYQHENIVIEDYIDFDFILPFCDLYITNGGYGGVILSLSHGVPTLASGITEGKNDINAHIRYFKVGLDLQTENPEAAKIRAATENILTNSGIKQNVGKLQKILNGYDPNELIEQYIFGKTKEDSEPEEFQALK